MASATLASAAIFESGAKTLAHDSNLHDTSMANTKKCVSILQMTTILKRCADELDQTSAEIASGSPSKRQRKQVANHQMVLAKAVRAVCDHQEQHVASTKGNGSSLRYCSLGTEQSQDPRLG